MPAVAFPFEDCAYASRLENASKVENKAGKDLKPLEKVPREGRII
jgi:hypothetical protein